MTRLQADGMALTLVNLSPVEGRGVVVAAGSFAEHRFGKVVPADGEEVAVDGGCFQVDLRPGAQVDLDISMQRYAAAPSFRFPGTGTGSPSASPGGRIRTPPAQPAQGTAGGGQTLAIAPVK